MEVNALEHEKDDANLLTAVLVQDNVITTSDNDMSADMTPGVKRKRTSSIDCTEYDENKTSPTNNTGKKPEKSKKSFFFFW